MNLGKKGFSLAEILVAVVILSIALVGIFSQIIQTRKGTQATLEELKGLGYAQDMSERIKSTPYNSLVEMDESEDENTFKKLKIDEDNELEKLENAKTLFKRFVTIKEFKQDFNTTEYKMKRVTVKVTWKIISNDAKNNKVSRDVSVKLDTMVRKLVN
jgi:prepilin-type N-terminal cleavage/methylation domain-containing protein